MIRHQLRCPLAVFLVATVLAACSKQEAAVPAATAAAPASAAATVPAKRVATACEMVPPAAMSAILGGAVTAKANDRLNGQTQCIYTAVAGISPYAELKVDWGDGKIAMQAMGMANKAEPGITNPLEGLGDRAVQIGPTLMIRSGEDLVTIIFSGVDDVLPRGRKVFALVKAAF